MYKLLKQPGTDNVIYIIRSSPWALIPLDSGNTDYQEYLRWLSEGNVPEAADSEG